MNACLIASITEAAAGDEFLISSSFSIGIFLSAFKHQLSFNKPRRIGRPESSRRHKRAERLHVCVLSDSLNLDKSAEEWEHSEIITLSLHINWSLNQSERFYFCGRKRVRRNSYQTDVYAFLTSAHTISGTRRFLGDTGTLLHSSYSDNMSSDFHFILQKPFSMTQTFCPCCSNQNTEQYSLFLRIGECTLCNAES